MDKKIKKYSWIHELNSAAMKTKLLNEAVKYANQPQNLNESTESIQGMYDLLTKVGVTIPKTKRVAGQFRSSAKDAIANPDPETVALLGGRKKDSSPDNSDMNGDGKGNAMEVQADVGADNEIDGDTVTDYENLGRLPTFNIPAQPVSTQYPEPTMAPGMSPDSYTRMGMQKAEQEGILPAGTMAAGERKRAKEAAIENVKAAAQRAFGASKGKLPASRKEAAMKAGQQAAADANALYALEMETRRMAQNKTGPKVTEADLRRMAELLGGGE